MSVPRTPIFQAIDQLNWNYGKGDVIEVDYTGSTFVQQPYGMRKERKKFTAVETADQTTVYALGHQKTIYHPKTYQVIDHGVCHCQYFSGCGTGYNTDFSIVFTGAGYNATEAYNDALDQAAMSGYDYANIRHDAFSRKTVPANTEDLYYYVSVRMTDDRKNS